MKKLTQLITVILLTTQVVTAQKQKLNEEKKFGFLIGGNFSNMNFNKGYPTPNTSVNTSWVPGITVGLLIRVYITDKLWIQPQYQFTQMGGKVDSSNTKYKLGYISMPVLLKYKPLPKLELEAGPQFDLLIHSKSVVNGTSTDITHGLQEPNYAVTAGIGYQIIKNLNIDLRFMQSLNHIGFGKLSDSAEFKFMMMQLEMSISF